MTVVPSLWLVDARSSRMVCSYTLQSQYRVGGYSMTSLAIPTCSKRGYGQFWHLRNSCVGHGDSILSWSCRRNHSPVHRTLNNRIRTCEWFRYAGRSNELEFILNINRQSNRHNIYFHQIVLNVTWLKHKVNLCLSISQGINEVFKHNLHLSSHSVTIRLIQWYGIQGFPTRGEWTLPQPTIQWHELSQSQLCDRTAGITVIHLKIRWNWRTAI
jgi:hypothetical protein